MVHVVSDLSKYKKRLLLNAYLYVKRATSANQCSQWEESSTSSAAEQNRKKKRSVSGRVYQRNTRVHEESTAARETGAATAEKGCLSSKVVLANC